MDIENWSETSYTLDEVLKEFSPPLTVLVEEGYMLNEAESLSAGQVIKIQSQETITQFKGFDEANKKVCIPLKCPFKAKVVSPLEGRMFNNIREICEAKPSTKFVKILSKGQKELANVTKGDRLKVLLTERGPEGPTFLHLRNQTGKHLRLPVELNGKFCECAESDEEHLIQDLVSKKLPFCIKFVVNSEKNSVSDLVGIIRLTELVNETLTFCTAYCNGKRFMAAFPVDFDVKVRPMNDSRRNEKPIDSKTENMKLKSIRESMLLDNLVSEGDYVRFVPLDDVESNQKSSRSPTQIDYEGLTEELSHEISHEASTVKDSELPLSRNDPKRKSTGFLSKVKSKLRGTKSNSSKQRHKRPEIVVLRDNNGTCSDGGDSGIYEEIPGDTYVSMDVIDGIRRTLGKSAVKPALRSSNSASEVPPPLPDNHPISRRHTVCMKTNTLKAKEAANKEQAMEKEKENFRKFYECMRKSEHELKELDIEGTAEILTKLKLNKYIKSFKENKIDGKLFVDLDEAVFKDMGLNPFESRKLRKYVFGWRPDEQETFSAGHNESKDNLNARLWSENEVEAHINSLGMKEFAKFCKDNQINGDLLWDIVVDEDMILELLNEKDRKLNVIKLKNYVTEGWRPKFGSNQNNVTDRNTAKVRSKSFNTGRKLQTGSEQSNVMKKASNYERVVQVNRKSSFTKQPVISRPVANGAINGNGIANTKKPNNVGNTSIYLRPHTSPTTDEKKLITHSSSLYEKPSSLTNKTAVLRPKTVEASSRNGVSKQKTPNAYEIPITNPALINASGTKLGVSKKETCGESSEYEEPVKRPASSKNKILLSKQSSAKESSRNKKTESTGLKIEKSSPRSKPAVPTPASSAKNTIASKPSTAARKVPVVRKQESRSVTPNSLISPRTGSPRDNKCVERCAGEANGEVNGETRPRSRLQAKVTYPKNSPYGKQDGNANAENKAKDAKADFPTKRQELKSIEKESLRHEQQKQLKSGTASKPSGPKSEIKQEQKKGTVSVGHKGAQGKLGSKNVPGKNVRLVSKSISPSVGKEVGTSLSKGKAEKLEEKSNLVGQRKNNGALSKTQSVKHTQGASNNVSTQKSEIADERKLQGSKTEKSSFVDDLKQNFERKNSSFRVVKADVQENRKENSKTARKKTEEAKLSEEETSNPRKSVAQLMRQFDRI